MPSTPKKRRFIVSDLGFSFAVHDTLARQDYAFEAGKSKNHRSSNQLNTKRVQLCPTRDEALRLAEDLNAKHEAGTLGW